MHVTCGRSGDAQHFIPPRRERETPEDPAPPSARADPETDVDISPHLFVRQQQSRVALLFTPNLHTEKS